MSNELTYPERAAIEQGAAQSLALQSVAKRFNHCTTIGKRWDACKIDLVNEMWAAGNELNQCAGPNRTQLTFNMTGTAYCRDHIIPMLPEGATVKWIKTCVRLASLMAKPVATVEEAEQFAKYAQTGMCLDDEPRGKQTAHVINLFCDIVKEGQKADEFMARLERDTPMDRWSREQAWRFVQAWKPMHERYRKAEEIASKDRSESEREESKP